MTVFLRQIINKTSLQKVYFASFMTYFILATGIIVLLAFYGGRQSLDASLREMQQEVSQRVYEQLSRYMQEPLRLNQINADNWQAGLLDLADPVNRERYFVNHLRSVPQAAMALVGLENGEFYGARRSVSGGIQVVRNNRETGGDSWYYSVSPLGDALERREIFKSFDPRTRPWYQMAKDLGHPVFTGVYRHFVFHERTVTATHPIFDAEGQLAGVFGVNYLLSSLGQSLRQIPIGPSGQICITDAEGLLVASSTPYEFFRDRGDGQFERVPVLDPLLHAAIQSLGETGLSGSSQIEHDDRSFLVNMRAFRENGLNWRIYVILARDDFLAGMRQTLRWIALAVLLAIVLAFFLTFRMARWITQPILRLNSAALELAEGRIQPMADTERRDELGQLACSFYTMALRITDFRKNLEDEVAERTAALEATTAEEQRLRQRLHKELEKAGREQKAMLLPDIKQDQLQLTIIYKPSMLVSGDFCGYHWVDEGTLFGYIIDVTGHGIATALQTAAINIMMMEVSHNKYSLTEIMVEINKRMEYYLKENILAAACCFHLDFEKKELRYIAAGITEFFAGSAAAKGRIKTPGPFLGLFSLPEFEIVILPIREGDILCFYSDGIADKLDAGADLPLNASFDEMVQEINHLVSGHRKDDCTAMCIKIGSMD